LASFGSPASRHAWEALREQSFVDLGPSTVTLVFGAGDVKVEELCHTFPLAARSPVFQVRNWDSNLLSRVSRKKKIWFSAKLGHEMSRIFLKCFYCSQEERIVIWEIIRERSSHYTCSAL
jgi:hypothetical protein